MHRSPDQEIAPGRDTSLTSSITTRRGFLARSAFVLGATFCPSLIRQGFRDLSDWYYEHEISAGKRFFEDLDGFDIFSIQEIQRKLVAFGSEFGDALSVLGFRQEDWEQSVGDATEILARISGTYRELKETMNLCPEETKLFARPFYELGSALWAVLRVRETYVHDTASFQRILEKYSQDGLKNPKNKDHDMLLGDELYSINALWTNTVDSTDPARRLSPVIDLLRSYCDRSNTDECRYYRQPRPILTGLDHVIDSIAMSFPVNTGIGALYMYEADTETTGDSGIPRPKPAVISAEQGLLGGQEDQIRYILDEMGLGRAVPQLIIDNPHKSSEYELNTRSVRLNPGAFETYPPIGILQEGPDGVQRMIDVACFVNPGYAHFTLFHEIGGHGIQDLERYLPPKQALAWHIRWNRALGPLMFGFHLEKIFPLIDTTDYATLNRHYWDAATRDSLTIYARDCVFSLALPDTVQGTELTTLGKKVSQCLSRFLPENYTDNTGRLNVRKLVLGDDIPPGNDTFASFEEYFDSRFQKQEAQHSFVTYIRKYISENTDRFQLVSRNEPYEESIWDYYLGEYVVASIVGDLVLHKYDEVVSLFESADSENVTYNMEELRHALSLLALQAQEHLEFAYMELRADVSAHALLAINGQTEVYQESLPHGFSLDTITALLEEEKAVLMNQGFLRTIGDETDPFV